MNVVQKELASRKEEIQIELELLFKANMKITVWDVAEVDNQEAAVILVDMLQEKLDDIHRDVDAGKYTNY